MFGRARPAVPALSALLAVALPVSAIAQGPTSRGAPPVIGPSGTAIAPTVLEIARSADGIITYVAHGYAPANATAAALAANATGDAVFRVGGMCVEDGEGGVVPSGVAGNTSIWSYTMTAVGITIVEDNPKGSCKYTVRVSYAVSLTGAVTVNQMEYTVFLRARPAAGAAPGKLTAIP